MWLTPVSRAHDEPNRCGASHFGIRPSGESHGCDPGTSLRRTGGFCVFEQRYRLSQVFRAISEQRYELGDRLEIEGAHGRLCFVKSRQHVVSAQLIMLHGSGMLILIFYRSKIVVDLRYHRLYARGAALKRKDVAGSVRGE